MRVKQREVAEDSRSGCGSLEGGRAAWPFMIGALPQDGDKELTL